MSWYGVVTDAGRRLLADYASGSASVNIDKITVGSGYIDESIMRNATDLTDPKDVGSIIRKKSVEEGVDFQFQFGPCANGSYVAREIGMWANSSTESPTLLALFQNDSGAQGPDASVNPNYVYILSVVLAISNLPSLTITCESEAFVPYRVFTPYTEEVEEALDGKVDKVEGKGLSTNDYTTAEKNKLSGIEEQANKYVLPNATESTLGGVKIGAGLAGSNGVIRNAGVRSVSQGSANGTISVNTDGTAADVPVKGLGTAAFTNVGNYAAASHVHSASDITSGVLPLARGGTGASTASGARTSIGAAAASHTHVAGDISGTFPITKGGTGATNAADARTNLGAAAASHNHDAGNITSGTLAVARGGTGLTSSPSMLTNLGSTSADTILKSVYVDKFRLNGSGKCSSGISSARCYRHTPCG